MSLWTEFKEFAIKGNVIDLAVGVIIGGAFGKITTSLVNDVVMPPIGSLLGGSDMAKKEIVLRPEVKDAAGKIVEQGASLKYGAFVNTIFDFVLIALVIFALVKVINYARRSDPAKPPDPTKTETLLAEIRDLLKRQQGSPLRARHNLAARPGPLVRPAAAHRRAPRPAAPSTAVSRSRGL